jgi:transporter family-2 protein
MLMVCVFLAGIGLTVQVGWNAALATATQSSTFAVLVNFLVGSLVLCAWLAIGGGPWPSSRGLLQAPWWGFLGGILGAFYVLTATLAGPKLGAATLLALTLLGQLTASVLVDHFGWLGFARQPLDAQRLLGIVLLLAGVLLVVKK